MSAILGGSVLVVAALLASADGARRAAAEAVPGGEVVTMRPDAVGNRPVWRLTVARRRRRVDVLVDGLTGAVLAPGTVLSPGTASDAGRSVDPGRRSRAGAALARGRRAGAT